MAVVTILSDFRAQEEEIYHCFHFFPFYVSRSDGTRCRGHSLFFFFLKFSSGLVHWDDPEGWDGDGVGRGDGRGVQDRELM